MTWPRYKLTFVSTAEMQEAARLIAPLSRECLFVCARDKTIRVVIAPKTVESLRVLRPEMTIEVEDE